MTNPIIKIVPMPGVPGATGPRGQVGPKGDTGDNGLSGASAYQIALGNGFNGTESQWLASLQGEKGDTGFRGADGNPGMTGASAYQLAISNGFVGSQSQWLASLVGPAGAKGDKGDTGSAGATGATGATGPKGDTGAAGADGTPTKGTWTPVWSGTGLVYGANTVTGHYVVVGDLVHFRIKFTLSNVQSFGTGAYTITLPFAPVADYIFRDGGLHSNGNHYNVYLDADVNSTTADLMYGAGNQEYTMDYNSPKVLTTTDFFYISGTYERAV
jgi:hypothetical protein